MLNIKFYPEMSFPGPQVTVVTVTFNAENHLPETIKSIISQSYPNIEYILIDGGSTDKTHHIISKYSDNIGKVLIEPDSGIYDAMNKAIDLAVGDWIIFINAGDTFYDSDTVKNVFKDNNISDYDFIYGDYIWQGCRSRSIVHSRPLEMMWQRISFSHQSLFSRTKLMKEKKFDTQFKIVCDYNFYFSAYMEGCNFLKKDFPVAVFRSGGISDVNFWQRTVERWKVVRRYRNDFQFHFFYLKLIINHYFQKLFNHG